jgi:hypothetical protein
VCVKVDFVGDCLHFIPESVFAQVFIGRDAYVGDAVIGKQVADSVEGFGGVFFFSWREEIYGA